MSGSATTPQHSYNIPGATTEFSQYLAHEKAKTIPVNNYDLNNSLRVWFLEFEQQALVHGIDDLNICSFHLTKYMPLVIQRWIPTLPVTVRKKFSLLKEALLNRFGMDAEDENRLLLKQLKQCKQLPRESIRLHAAKWEHLLSLITDTFSAQTKISFFIQSLEQRDTRLTLTSLVAALNINTVDDVIQQAINLEVRAKLLDVPETVETNSDVVPMEIDYINRHNNKQYSSKKKQFNNYNNHNNKLKGHGNAHQQQSEKAPRLYDRHGNPVCGYCFQQHRTIDCSQHQGKRRFAKNSKKYNVHTVDTISVTQEGVVNLDAPMRVVNSDTIVAQPSINHVNYQHTNTPISYLSIGKTKIQILWDTGSAITCIAKSVTDKLKLPIDKSQIILYTDVNRNANKTHGVIKLDVFNTTLKLHVIDELARDVIIGYDTMRLWKAMIDTTGQVISLSIQNVQHVVKFLVNPNLDVSNTANSVCYTSIQPQIDKLLVKYNSIIPADNDKPSTTDLVEFTIDTGDSPPVYSAPRVYHPDIQKKIDEKLEKLVKNGIVSKVTFSEWGSNVSAVPKPDGDIRPCGNYVKLNSITQTIKYPFVHIHHALQSLGKSIIFSKIDLASGYYAIKIAEEDKKKTALVTTNGTYIFNFMPFGLKNAPAVFQSLMDRVLGPLKYTTAIAYLDDVIIHSSSVEQHIIDLENVLRRIQSANLSINRKKCAFGMKSIEFLGFIVSDRGISANPDKIKAIQVLPAPTSLKEIEQFLGVCGVYQKFISNYQVIAEPLRRLKKKDVEFVWSEEQQQAFETLKDRLATLPTLVQPDFKRPFELHCDAATTSGIGVILCQRDDDEAIYPISFSSRSITKFEQKYSIRELEALSIVWGIKKNRIYLESGHFLVYTDHSSLQWLLSTNQDKQPRLWRWCLFLQAYSFDVKYIPGHKNVVADMLSRNPLPNVAAISAGVPWYEESWWVTEQAKDNQLAIIINQLQAGSTADKTLHLHKGILCKKVKYSNKATHYKMAPAHMVSKIIEFYHASQFAGHGGSNKTYKAIQHARIYFAEMEKTITVFIKSCLPCQQIKGDRSKQFPLSSTVGSRPFQKIAMDYFGPLSTSNTNNKYVLVIIDTFTRYVELYPVASTNTMELAKVFYYGFVLRHGIPDICLQDNGSSFASEFNQQLAVFAGIQLQFTPPYVASSNGLVERFMKTLRQMILLYCSQENIKSNWDVHLRLIRFVYNNMYHSSIKTSPFELVHGRKAQSPMFITDSQENVKYPAQYRNVETPQSHFAKELEENLNTAFEIVYEQMKTYDNSIDYQAFKQGDKVLIFNMQLSTIAKPRKLAFDWYGPFFVEDVLSSTRYNLKNCETGKTLSNMHISLLKPFYECNLLY